MIALLRGVNVTGNNMIRMEALRELCGSLGLGNVRTYIQSGNVVFDAEGGDPDVGDSHVGKRLAEPEHLAQRIEDAIAERHGFRPRVTLRSREDLMRLVEANPFPHYAKSEPNKLLVNFLCEDPGEAKREAVRGMPFDPEEVWIEGREMIVYYPTGQGKSKLRWAPIEKIVGLGTARNWNTVLKLIELAG